MIATCIHKVCNNLILLLLPLIKKIETDTSCKYYIRYTIIILENMNVLKKQILSRSIVRALIGTEMFPHFMTIDSEICDEISKLLCNDQLQIFNYIANINTLAGEYICCSIGHSSSGFLIEARTIRMQEFNDQQLYEMIIKTFIFTVFSFCSQEQKQNLINSCHNKENFDQLIEMCISLNYTFETNQCNENNYEDDSDYDMYDNYDEGYDSVS